MSLIAVPGSPAIPIGPMYYRNGVVASSTLIIDAANEAVIFAGRIATSDGGSHTLDTSGSSAIWWRTGSVTFSNAGTTVKVGVAAVDTANGPPVRAANVANVITFDVSKSLTGGGGGITANAWQTHVPDTGTKTIAHGDQVAVCIQMTALGGADTIQVVRASGTSSFHSPTVTAYLGGTYSEGTAQPNMIIKFSDGAFGWFYASDLTGGTSTRTWNSGSATKEYGQLYSLPFPTKIYGVYGWVDPDANYDLVLYSDPLGTPVAERTVTIDANTAIIAQGRLTFELFSSPYTLRAGQNVVVAFKPGASNISAYYKTIGHADHRITDPWGTSGYGVGRATGAFSNANSSLDHYYIGLVVGAFEHGVSPTYACGV